MWSKFNICWCNLYSAPLTLFQVPSKTCINSIFSPFHNPKGNALWGASFGGNSFHIHNSTTNGSWNESSVMRFDQTLKLNETWRELARGPMRDDSADGSQEKHLARPRPRPHATGPGAFPPSSMSRGSHQTPLLQICISSYIWPGLVLGFPAQIQTWSDVSGYWRKRAVQPGNRAVKT